jgi:hypothetical protein
LPTVASTSDAASLPAAGAAEGDATPSQAEARRTDSSGTGNFFIFVPRIAENPPGNPAWGKSQPNYPTQAREVKVPYGLRKVWNARTGLIFLGLIACII